MEEIWEIQKIFRKHFVMKFNFKETLIRSLVSTIILMIIPFFIFPSNVWLFLSLDFFYSILIGQIIFEVIKWKAEKKK